MLICDGCGKKAEHPHFKVNSSNQQFCDLDLCDPCAKDLDAALHKVADEWHQPRATQAAPAAPAEEAHFQAAEASPSEPPPVPPPELPPPAPPEPTPPSHHPHHPKKK